MGPGNSAERVGECVTRCKVSSSMERRETRTESRGRRIRGCGLGECVLERADLCDRSSPGRVLRWSSGRPCIRTKRVSLGTRGVKYSGMRSHGRAACEASSTSSMGAHDSGSLSRPVGVRRRARRRATLRCCTPSRPSLRWQRLAAADRSARTPTGTGIGTGSRA